MYAAILPRTVGACVFSMVMSMGSSLPAVAQTATATANEPADGLAEIVVTATKREQLLLDVPASVSAVDANQLADAGVGDPQDLTILVPGLVVSETIGRQTTNVILRGVSGTGFADPTVQLLTDGFTIGFTRNIADSQLVELERVEILKGPQPTLYGRNALGGIINYVTRKPGDVFRASLHAEAANRGSYRVGGVIEGPLVRDLLSAQLGVNDRRDGGFLFNEFSGERNVNDSRDLDVRVAARLRPTSAIDVNLAYTRTRSRDDCGDCAWTLPTFNPFSAQSYRNIGQGVYDFTKLSFNIRQTYLGFYDVDTDQVVLNATWDLGFAELSSVSGWARTDSTLRSDFLRQGVISPTNGRWQQVVVNQEGASQEIRLASDDDGRMIWLVGAYGFKFRRPPTPGIAFELRPGAPATTKFRNENWAGFANVEYRVTDRLSVIGGLRYDHDERRLITLATNAVARQASADTWLPTATVAYRVSEPLRLYATFARGYHAGGYNNPATAPSNFLEYGPEYLDNFEVGLKGLLRSPNLSYTVAVYRMAWDDQQLTQFTANSLGTFIVNGGSSTIRGIEASVTAVPIEGLTLTVGGNYNDAKYDDYFDPANATAYGVSGDFSGKRIPNAPKFSASVSAQYRAPINQKWSLRLRGDYLATTKRYFDPANLLYGRGYDLGNFYAGGETDRFEIGAFINNAFNQVYAAGGFLLPSTYPPLLTIGRAREYGLRASIRY